MDNLRRCGTCSKRLTGRQERWCSKSCRDTGWSIEHAARRNELQRQYRERKLLPPELRPVVAVPMTDLAAIEQSGLTGRRLARRLREAVADIKTTLALSQ